MGIIDHWHPLLSSRELRHRPVGVKLCGRDLVLFRTPDGVGALDDSCPHRRSRLSTGVVIGDRLQCPYHAWTFDRFGNGESPGTPKMTATAKHYETREAYHYIWVKPPDAQAEFPDFEVNGFRRIGELRHRMPAPLELVVDNFLEIEHTTINHRTFGHDLDNIANVKVACDATDDTVSVRSSGPTKSLSFSKRLFLGVKNGDHFHADDVVHFSPVYTKFDHWWTSPDGSREGLVRWRLFIVFVPEDETTTTIVSFMYAKSRWLGASIGWKFIGPIYLRETDREVRRDVVLLSNLTDQSTSLEGMKLSRFDKVLGLTRERIDRLYRGGV